MFSMEGHFVVEATKDLAHSALPDAPVVPDKPPKARRSRETLARALRSIADRLEPSRCVDPALSPRAQ